MSKAMATLEEKGLAVLDEDIVIKGNVAWNLAQLISDAETDVRLAKGKFWNRCERGTREEICESFGWNYPSMRRYGMYADECSGSAPSGAATYSLWNAARDAGVNKEDRPALLEKAAKKGWDNKQIRTEAAKILGDLEKKKKEIHIDKNTGKYVDGLGNPFKNPESSATPRPDIHTDDAREYRKNIQPETKKMSKLAAFEVFGISGAYRITTESLTILYRGLSKARHPDAGGSEAAMTRLNEAYNVLNN